MTETFEVMLCELLQERLEAVEPREIMVKLEPLVFRVALGLMVSKVLRVRTASLEPLG